MTRHIVVFITAPSTEVGEQIAEALLAAKLAACVNIVPAIHSLYTWQGETHNDAEVLCIAKTTAAAFEGNFIPAVKAVHPYEVPEIIALPIVMGSPAYLNWIDAEVTG